MKRLLFYFTILMLITGSCKKDNSANLLSVGDNYQGGIIGYILQPGDPGYVEGVQHGLIVAPADAYDGEWGCYGTELDGSDALTLGSGNQNTQDIVAGCSTTGIAAKICADLVLGGYSDWYLPSLNELSLIYSNKAKIGGFSSNYHWSSSEYDADYAWFVVFETGQETYGGKNGQNEFRPIRSF
ncbi:MAG: DUF1566 domain-containing protein [Bacteroidia bacterium]|nr:DUF1566 domain-containing protein [Bacteroidia bacterium]